MQTRLAFAVLALPFAFSACKSAASSPPRAVALNFDTTAAGTIPDGWAVGSTHAAGAHASWSVRSDAKAPSAPNVLAMTRASGPSNDTFNLCWTSTITMKIGAIDVRLRADGGDADQGGGVMWRVQGPDDYYICRYNPLESNFRVYVVSDGVRRQIATASVPGDGEGWHHLRIEHGLEGRITCTLDGATKLEAQDDTLPHVGGVGLWTKADAVTSFDDLKVEPWEAR